jgi:hypothetical protein
MAGLVPAIHVLGFKDVDARDERGHDDITCVDRTAVLSQSRRGD